MDFFSSIAVHLVTLLPMRLLAILSAIRKRLALSTPLNG
jgi:hypothetical protein